MTRKDYELIAFAIGNEISMGRPTIEDIINALGGAFALDNPRFDYQGFESAIKYYATGAVEPR